MQEQVLKNPGIGSDGYVELLNPVVKPWITRVAKVTPYVWQQDSAPCHTSGKGTKWLSEIYYDFPSPNVWPPNSLDLNPMDYFVWGVVEKDANRTSSNTKAQLMYKVKTVFEALPRETVASACSRFRSRIKAVIDANGGYFE
ncbi:Transposable element Tcb2 transposase, partial [Stegodyphus mimosarum]